MRRNFLLRRKRARLFQVSTNVQPSYTRNIPATITVSTTGGEGTNSIDVFDGALPPGMTLVGQTIAGTPTTAGTYSFAIRVWDARDTLKILRLTVVIT